MESTNILRSGSSSGGPAEMASIGGGSSEAVSCSGAANHFDLHVGVDLEVDGLHGMGSNKGAKRKLPDLNEKSVDADADAESLKKLKRFDLNVELNEEEASTGETEADVSGLQPPPAKVKLPPSSALLDLRGASFFDFISVYAFLRSFSTVLFLSPFVVVEFAASVVSNESTPLFNAIHLALMREVRRHTSASTHLRSLNWDLLDSISWTVFLVEYLLLRKPKHIPGLDLSELSPLETDYYSMPTSIKVAVMQLLCDDLVETKVYRSELREREAMAESGYWKMKYFSSKGKKRARIEENGDECFLCKMAGNLICCDSCPAAMHARCVGVVSNELSKGDWHCPECRLEQGNRYNLANSTRGAQLLGADLHGRLYHQVCNYLLVVEQNLCADADECSVMVYNRDDLAAVVAALNESPCVLHETIIRAINKHWNTLSREVQPMTRLRAHSTQGRRRASYEMNLYEFAGMASFISEEMTSAVTATRRPEQIMKQQLKIIRRGGKPTFFSWANTYNLNVYLNSMKEKCGWCFACNNARGCLFIASGLILSSNVLGIPPSKGPKKHRDDFMGNMARIEWRLQPHLQDTRPDPRRPDNVATLNKLLIEAADHKCCNFTFAGERKHLSPSQIRAPHSRLPRSNPEAFSSPPCSNPSHAAIIIQIYADVQIEMICSAAASHRFRTSAANAGHLRWSAAQTS